MPTAFARQPFASPAASSVSARARPQTAPTRRRLLHAQPHDANADGQTTSPLDDSMRRMVARLLRLLAPNVVLAQRSSFLYEVWNSAAEAPCYPSTSQGCREGARATPTSLQNAVMAAMANGPPCPQLARFSDPSTSALVRVPMSAGSDRMLQPPRNQSTKGPRIPAERWLVRREEDHFWLSPGGAEKPLYIDWLQLRKRPHLPAGL